MPETDEQDQSETFDETHLDDEGDTTMLLDELDPVFDATQAAGDSDVDDDEDDGDEEADEADDGLRQRETLEAEADALLNAGETEGD
ncbi:primosomal protein, partial [Klebsiella pneumoniae]|uniref:hypothetical protein n=1 Tax=Klebsiella pneumoniae TaxID=573 RepID=UPI00359C240E|nr:primosomal protein [Klebsiella pneumoniae]